MTQPLFSAPCSPVLSQENRAAQLLRIPGPDRDGGGEITTAFPTPHPGTSLTGSLGKEEPILNAPWGLEWNSLHQTCR